MAQQTTRKHYDEKTGHDIPDGDGTVSDEDVNSIDGPDKKVKTGQDHSLDNYEETMPDHGVGDVQDSSDTSTDIYHESQQKVGGGAGEK